MAIIQSMFYIPTALLYAGCRRPDNPSAENIDFLEQSGMSKCSIYSGFSGVTLKTLRVQHAPFGVSFLNMIKLKLNRNKSQIYGATARIAGRTASG